MHEVQCRLCRNRFDIDTEEYIVIGKKSYYHKDCYEMWISGKNSAKAELDETFWEEAMIDYLYRDIGMNGMDFKKISSQWKNFTNPEKKMTPKGIFFAVKYFYDILKGNAEKAKGGIGIVPSIYKESAAYWTKLEERKAGTLEAIIQQIQSREHREVQVIKRKEAPKKDKSKWSLDSI